MMNLKQAGSKIAKFFSTAVPNEPKCQLPQRTVDYLKFTGNRISDVKTELREETEKKYPALAEMLTSLQGGELIKSLVMIHKGVKGIELGTFTGYSALCMAEALPSHGELIAMEINQEFIEFAQPYWKRAGVDKKIKPALGDARDTLKKLLEDPANIESFDFAYMDADKERYSEYYEALLKLIRPKGIIIIDNVLWEGKVYYDHFITEETEGVKAINRLIKNDPRLEHLNMIALDDGVSIAIKK